MTYEFYINQSNLVDIGFIKALKNESGLLALHTFVIVLEVRVSYYMFVCVDRLTK